MKWASAVSVEPLLEAAIVEVGEQVRRQLGGAAPDLVVAFVSEHHRDAYARVPALVARMPGSGLLIGCSAGGVIGGGREIERRPGVSMTAALLPDVELTGFHLDTDALPNPGAGPRAWEDLVHVRAERNPQFLLLADPFTCDAEAVLQGLDRSFPRGSKVGGLASGAQQVGTNALYLGRDMYRAGLVGVAMCGDIEVDTIVAQGCRPIGEPMFVTGCQRNIVRELDGRPALKVLQELYQQLDARDQELFRHSLFLGIVMDESRQQYRQGDFLIRNIVGMDSATGALAIGAMLRESLVVQFHLRDAETSAEDLDELLARHARGGHGRGVEGSLLFSCLGRGAALYGRPDHDSEVFRRRLGEIPLGGFFCNGEIGPLHGSTFLHGYTSAFGLFRSRKPLA